MYKIYILAKEENNKIFISNYFFKKKENAESRIEWLEKNKNQKWGIIELKQDKFEINYDESDYCDYSIPEDLGDQL